MVGPHTFDKKNENTIKDAPRMANKTELLDFCETAGYAVMNTWCEKKDEQLITWRHPGTKPHHNKVRGHYAVKDYWLAPNGWKNSVTDCNSDHSHNININSNDPTYDASGYV